MFASIPKRFSSSQVLLVNCLGNGIKQFSMNRAAQRNALSVQLVDEFADAIRENRDARCVILRSEAPGMFCAGADLKERKAMSQEEVHTFLFNLRATLRHLEEMECPTISVIDGAALGGGCEMALCTDMRITTQSAIFGLPETALAIIPGAGGTQRLPRLIGQSRAKELIFTADRIDAQRALEIGLVNYLAPDYESANAKALEIAEKICKNGPIAVRAAKAAINGYDYAD